MSKEKKKPEIIGGELLERLKASAPARPELTPEEVQAEMDEPRPRRSFGALTPEEAKKAKDDLKSEGRRGERPKGPTERS